MIDDDTKCAVTEKDMDYVLKINDNFHGHGSMHYMAELILSYLCKHGKNISEINFSIVTYDQYKKSLKER